jgi:outer membrane protein TolC
MNTSLPRLTARLAVPLFALAALVAAGDPMPAPAVELSIEAQVEETLALALQQEADAMRQEAEATKKAAQRSAARMRWFLTLPAAGNHRRCATPGCTS